MEKKGDKDTQAEFILIFSILRWIFDCCKTHSPCSALAFARTKPDFGAWAAELQDLGQNFMSQAELCEAVCSGKVPFYLCELAAFFSMQGHPLESLLQRNSVQTLMKTVTLPPSPNSPWVYGPEEKCSHPAKQQEENHLPKIKLFSNFFFFFFHTPHLSGLPCKPGSSKTIYQPAGLGPPNQPFLESFGLPVWLENKFSANSLSLATTQNP